MEGHLEYYDTHLDCAWLIRGDIPPWPTFPLVTYSWNFELKSSTIIYSSSDHPMLLAKAQGPIYNLGPYPYNVQCPLKSLTIDFQHLFYFILSIINPYLLMECTNVVLECYIYNENFIR